MSDPKGHYIVRYKNNGQIYSSDKVFCVLQAVDMYEARKSKYGNAKLIRVGKVEMVLKEYGSD